MTLHSADQFAFDKAIETHPVWDGFDAGKDAVQLPQNVLLHAGPAFSDPRQITIPILNSACVAAVYEGLADNFSTAENMILSGDILLKPAQDFCVVVPLSVVVSASMPLHRVSGALHGAPHVYAPINGGNRPALRLGLRSEEVLDHIRWLNTRFLDVLEKGLSTSIPLLPLAVTGLHGGDDCHGYTPVAAKALVDQIKKQSPDGIEDPKTLEFMETSPSLFLNLWMAATKCMMKAAEGIADSSFITAAGGNGREVGIQVSGLPGQWFTTPATAPKGNFDIDVPTSRALGAIGDSAIIEAFGLGAMAIQLSPKQLQSLGAFLPSDAEPRSAALACGTHPGCKPLGIDLGSTARGASGHGTGPVISLGIIDNEGRAGRLGGGIYDMPVAPFKAAMKALNQKSDAK